MILLRLFLVLLLTGMFLTGYSQVGIGTKHPDNSAALHIKSSSKGLLIPEITDRPLNPKKGLLYFDPTENKYFFFDSINWQVINPIPLGGIIMWSGSEIPYGWALCDGKYYSLKDHTLSADTYFPNSIKTPNLTNRFVMGANPEDSNNYNRARRAINDTSVVLTAANIPRHNHAVDEENGEHTHTAAVVIDPDTHAHDYNTLTNREDARTGTSARSSNDTHDGRTDFTTSEDTHDHSATVTINSAGNHDHGNTSEWGGDASGDTRSFDIIPPYYTLAFIMRIK